MNTIIEKILQEDEWTQEELKANKELLEKEGIEVVLVDTILKPIDGVSSIVYNPFLMKEYPKGTVFVFYCDSGKNSKNRLPFYRSKLPQYHCVSLKGGRGYWRNSIKI